MLINIFWKSVLILAMIIGLLSCISFYSFTADLTVGQIDRSEFKKTIEVDLDGNGSIETIEISSDRFWGLLKVFGKKDDSLVQIWQSPDKMVGSFGDLKYEDINGDSQKEIVINWASMRYQNMWIYSWQKGKNKAIAISPKSNVDGISLFAGEAVEINDIDGDNKNEIVVHEQVERGPGVDMSKVKRKYDIYKWNGKKYYLAEIQYDYSPEEVIKYLAIATKYVPDGYKPLSVEKRVKNGKEFTFVEYFGPISPPKLYGGGLVVFENKKGELTMLAKTTELMKGSLSPTIYLSGINSDGSRILITSRQYNADMYVWVHTLSRDKAGNYRLMSVTPAGENPYVSGIKNNLRAGNYSIKDLNGDGIMEIVVNDFNDKNEKIVKYYKWNGKQYVYGGIRP